MAAITLPGLGRFNIIDDDSYLKYADDSGTRTLRGYQGRNYSKYPFGSMPWGTIPFRLIPRNEWKDRIAEGHAKKTFPIYHQLRKKVPILNQKTTSFCWMYAVTGAVQSVRACSGFPTEHLSATSAGGPGKNYRNEGGWTGEAIGYAKKFGIATVDTWPEAVLDRRYFNPSRGEAEKHNVGEWFELRPKAFDEIMTCLLMNYPVSVGLLWWGHAVFYSAPVWDSGPGVICDNSWGPDWENEGRTVLMESKANADEANVITSCQLSGDVESTSKKFKSFYNTLSAGRES